MVKLEEVVNLEALAGDVLAGYVTARKHPQDRNLVIYNYTDKAQFDNYWTNETMHCRGLIVHAGEIIARGWKKFFNYGQEGAPRISPGADVVARDKCDGSLGIAYMAPDGEWAIATRGSFESEQAIHATELLRSKPEYLDFLDRAAWDACTTPLFEIIYPENRIVVDYGDQDDLIGLGVAHIRTGLFRGWPYTPSEFDTPPWPMVEEVFRGRFEEALALPDRKGKEGVVIATHAGEMVKIKQQEYLELHRVVTGLSELALWRAWCEDRHPELIESLPDEWQEWAFGVTWWLEAQFQATLQVSREAHEMVCASLPEDASRKDFALAIKDHPDKALLFLLYDDRQQDVREAIKKSLRPKGSQPQEREVAA